MGGLKEKQKGIHLYSATVMRLKLLGATGKSRGKRVSYDVVINALIDFYETKDRKVANMGKKRLEQEENGKIWVE